MSGEILRKPLKLSLFTSWTLPLNQKPLLDPLYPLPKYKYEEASSSSDDELSYIPILYESDKSTPTQKMTSNGPIAPWEEEVPTQKDLSESHQGPFL